MNNIVNVYHVRDAYDHERGYSHHNTYMNIADEKTVKEFNIITENIKIQKIILLKMINNIAIFINEKKHLDKYNKICSKISALPFELKSLIEVNLIIEFLDLEIINIDKFLEIVTLLIKKISKNEE